MVDIKQNIVVLCLIFLLYTRRLELHDGAFKPSFYKVTLQAKPSFVATTTQNSVKQVASIT